MSLDFTPFGFGLRCSRYLGCDFIFYILSLFIVGVYLVRKWAGWLLLIAFLVASWAYTFHDVWENRIGIAVARACAPDAAPSPAPKQPHTQPCVPLHSSPKQPQNVFTRMCTVAVAERRWLWSQLQLSPLRTIKAHGLPHSPSFAFEGQ